MFIVLEISSNRLRIATGFGWYDLPHKYTIPRKFRTKVAANHYIAVYKSDTNLNYFIVDESQFDVWNSSANI